MCEHLQIDFTRRLHLNFSASERRRTPCSTSSTSLCWAKAIVLKLIWSGGLIQNRHLHTHETHRQKDKRKGRHCLSLLISNKRHTFSTEGDQRYQYRGRMRKLQQTEQESGRKQAFPRITSALLGPAQFATTKQPPRSHRGTSGQPLSSLWEQQALLSLTEKLQAPLFFLTDISKHTFAPKRKWKANTYIHTLWKLNHPACGVIF